MAFIKAIAVSATIVLSFAAPALAQSSTEAVHASLLTLDTHLDTPANFSRQGWDIIDRHAVKDRSQVDYPRMVEGGLKGGFFAIFTPQGLRTPEGDRDARDAGDLTGICGQPLQRLSLPSASRFG